MFADTPLNLSVLYHKEELYYWGKIGNIKFIVNNNFFTLLNNIIKVNYGI